VSRSAKRRHSIYEDVRESAEQLTVLGKPRPTRSLASVKPGSLLHPLLREQVASTIPSWRPPLPASFCRAPSTVG